MYLSGKTPLIRARNLEKHLNVEKIYLKLEGKNPRGSKMDRICESNIRYFKTRMSRS